MRSTLPMVGAVIAAACLKVGLAPYLAVGGVVPNLMLHVVVTFALVEGPMVGCAVGFASGLIFDLLGSGPVGPMIFVLTITGYLAGLMHANMFAEGWLLPITVLAIASLGSEIAYGLIMDMFGAGGPFLAMFVTKILPGAVYDTALALLVYPWLARILRQDRGMTTFRRMA